MGEINFYYLKDENGKSYGCVAFCENADGTITRGVSLCSKEDSFKKITARGIALKRMNDAIKNKNSKLFHIYYGSHPTCPTFDDVFIYKSAYAVAPTAKEYRILHKPETV